MLVVFTVYVPRNSGLERFNYLVQGCFEEPIDCVMIRGETIPKIVDQFGEYGWTGNDLFQDYRASGLGQRIRVKYFVPWPGETQPRLCLLGPEEITPPSFLDDMVLSAPSKYGNLTNQFLRRKGWNPTVLYGKGQVERQIRLGNADLAIDIVCSGRTIKEDGLIIYETIFDDSGLVLLTKDI